MLRENLRVGVLGDGESGGMFHPPVRSDRVEIAPAFFHSRDHTKSILFQSDAINHRGHNRETATARRTDFHQGRVFEFADYLWANPLLIEPGFEHRAHAHI